MDANTVIIYHPLRQENRDLEFLDILLDETLIFGTVYVPTGYAKNISGINKRLPAKQVYEYVLRLAKFYQVRRSANPPQNPSDYIEVRETGDFAETDGLQTDCYLAARYKDILLKHHLFDAVIECILSGAARLNCRQQTISFLEEMLQKKGDYPYFYQGSQPFLIYKGSRECYQVLDGFAKCLGGALQNQGYVVEYFDMAKERHTALSRYIGKSYQAVIGMQTYLFSARMENGGFLHDLIQGPKYNFVFDHPLWLQCQLQNMPKSLTILTLDKDYAAFVRRYHIQNAYFLPPGGIQEGFAQQKRIYDLTFIGSYIDRSKYILESLRQMERQRRFLINRLWMVMRKEPCLPVEEAVLRAVSESDKRTLSKTEFLELCYELREYILYLSQHYRKKLLKTLVDSGIRVDVFGESWEGCPLRRSPNFIWHKKDLDVRECLNVWQQSRISLNIMSCHKNAITERIANSMLQKAVVCTERNPYLESQFEDGKDILFYDLADLEKLPGRIKGLLESERREERLKTIGENGCRKAMKWHTWDCRAKEIVEMAREDVKETK